MNDAFCWRADAHLRVADRALGQASHRPLARPEMSASLAMRETPIIPAGAALPAAPNSAAALRAPDLRFIKYGEEMSFPSL
eukprot:5732583-Pyramimonas_sp.AAC.1